MCVSNLLRAHLSHAAHAVGAGSHGHIHAHAVTVIHTAAGLLSVHAVEREAGNQHQSHKLKASPAFICKMFGIINKTQISKSS